MAPPNHLLVVLLLGCAGKPQPSSHANRTGIDGDQADDSADAAGAVYVYDGFGPARRD